MNKILELLLTATISGSVVGVIFQLFLKRRTEVITAEIRNQFEQNMTVFKSSYAWKEKSVSLLLGPICLQFNRTKRAFDRYSAKNLFLEAEVLKDGNKKIRNLLLENAYLIPNELLEDATKLIEHYDVWLEEYHNLRESKNPKFDEEFVYGGPQGFPFPRKSEEKFKFEYRKIWDELYV
jgi:hypothetical protein